MNYMNLHIQEAPNPSISINSRDKGHIIFKLSKTKNQILKYKRSVRLVSFFFPMRKHEDQKAVG